MKMNAKITVLLFSILVANNVSCASQINNETKGNSLRIIAEDITIEESYDMIRKNKGKNDFVILDVRTPQEYNTGHIEFAVNKNYTSNEFKKMLSALDTDKTYLVYCRTGSRSSNAQKVMTEMGFKNTYNMLGGITAWLEAGYPTVGY